MSIAISIVIGAVAFFFPLPLVVPVIGLALGANGIVKEQKKGKDERRTGIVIAGIIGILLCAAVLILSFSAGAA